MGDFFESVVTGMGGRSIQGRMHGESGIADGLGGLSQAPGMGCGNALDDRTGRFRRVGKGGQQGHRSVPVSDLPTICQN
jgi:hypothetical protein